MTEPTPKEIDDLVYELRQAGTDDTYSLVCAVLAKWGTPAPVGVEPVAWSTGIAWHPDPRCQSEMVLKLTRRAQPMYGYTVPLYTAPTPTQPQAGAVPLTDEMASKAGRALSDLYATECDVEKEDNWKVYGSDFIATAKLVLEAVGIKGGQHGTE